jgi:RecA-family ATPase
MKIGAGDLKIKDLPKVEYLINGLIPMGLSYFFGSQGSFKTNFLLWATIESQNVDKIFGLDCKPFKTLWIDEENREIGMKDKISKISNGFDISEEELNKILRINTSEEFDILNDSKIKDLCKDIEEFKPNLIVIDSLSMVFNLDDRDPTNTKNIYRKLRPIIEKYNVAVVIIHHAIKKNFLKSKQDIYDMAGSKDLARMADAVVMLCKTDDEQFLIKHVKARYGKEEDGINFIISGDEHELNVFYEGKAAQVIKSKIEDCEHDIMDWAKDKDGKTFKRKDILSVMLGKEHKASAIDSALTSLRTSGKCEYTYGKYIF